MQRIGKNIWFTLIIAAVFLWVLGQWFPKNPDKYLKERFWTLKTHKNPYCNFIILGDSRAYRGVSPKVIEQVLPNFDVYNFAFSNGGLNQQIFDAADKRLSEKEGDKVILLAVTAFALNDLSIPNKKYMQELTRPREEVFERRYFGKYLNYFSPVTPEIVRDLLKGIRPKRNYVSVYHDNGWVASQKTPIDTMEAMPYYKKDFSKHTTNYQLLDVMCQQIEYWNKQGITVFAFRPPAAAPLLALEDSTGNYNEHLIKQKIEQASGIWIEINANQFKTYDGSHLPTKEAEKLSKEIALSIKQKLMKR